MRPRSNQPAQKYCHLSSKSGGAFNALRTAVNCNICGREGAAAAHLARLLLCLSICYFFHHYHHFLSSLSLYHNSSNCTPATTYLSPFLLYLRFSLFLSPFFIWQHLKEGPAMNCIDVFSASASFSSSSSAFPSSSSSSRSPAAVHCILINTIFIINCNHHRQH